MTKTVWLSRRAARNIGWAILVGPVAGAAFATLNTGLWVLASALATAAAFFLVIGYGLVSLSPYIRVEADESTRATLLDERAQSDDIRSVDVLVTHGVSVRWFVQRLVDRGKSVRLLVHHPDFAFDSAEKMRCLASLHDIVTSIDSKHKLSLSIIAYPVNPSIRAIVLRDNKGDAVLASVGWYSYLGKAVGGSRHPALLFSPDAGDLRPLIAFINREIDSKAQSGEALPHDEIVQRFNESRAASKRSSRRSG